MGILQRFIDTECKMHPGQDLTRTEVQCFVCAFGFGEAGVFWAWIESGNLCIKAKTSTAILIPYLRW